MNEATTTTADNARAARIGAILALTTALSALFYYKWSGSLRVYGAVHATGKLTVDPSVLLHGGLWAATLAYFAKIWPALLYGVTIGAVVRAAVPPEWIARSLGGRGLRGALVGGVVGAPLMLCSCCVTPIFTGLRERGAKLSSSLGVMLGAPGFNLAAIVLTFLLLPAKLAVARAIAAMVIVVGLPALVGRADAPPRSSDACEVPEAPSTPTDFARRFATSFAHLTAVTVPLIVLGVVLGGLALPHVARLGELGVAAGVALVALAAVLVALPTFFEIPIALLLLDLGLPGAALAVLVAGPVVNLPSLLVVARETRPRVALALAAGVWGVATLAGLFVSGA